MARELLSAEDARILALESGTVRGHTCKVIVIGGERSAEQVRAQLGERLGAVPRLMRRLEPGTAPPAWEDDPGFSLERHVIDRGALDDAGLRRLVCTAMETPLDRDHPLWAMDVVSPLAGGRTALVWRIHHAVADGMTAMRMARELLLEATASARRGPARGTRPAAAHGRRPDRGRCRRCASSWGGAPSPRRSTGASAHAARSPSSTRRSMSCGASATPRPSARR